MSETNASVKSEDVPPPNPSEPVGRMVVEYLSKRDDGASLAHIVQYLRKEGGLDQVELNETVAALLRNGISLGFLEREGSHYKNWNVREAGCGRRRKRRRKSCCCTRRPSGCRKRRRRKRSCRRRRRRRRRCC